MLETKIASGTFIFREDTTITMSDHKKEERMSKKQRLFNIVESFDENLFKLKLTQLAFEKYNMEVHWVEQKFEVFGWPANLLINDKLGNQKDVSLIVDDMQFFAPGAKVFLAMIYYCVPLQSLESTHVLYFTSLAQTDDALSKEQSEKRIACINADLSNMLQNALVKKPNISPQDFEDFAKDSLKLQVEWGIDDFNDQNISYIVLDTCKSAQAELTKILERYEKHNFTKIRFWSTTLKNDNTSVLYYMFDPLEAQKAVLKKVMTDI